MTKGNLKINSNKVDELIQEVLKKSKRPISTYEIAKRANISWSTANAHCYKLKSFGIIDAKRKETRLGRKKIVWWMKK